MRRPAVSMIDHRDVEAMLEELAPGEYRPSVIFHSYANHADEAGRLWGNPHALAFVLNESFSDRASWAGGRWTLTVKCQDDAEARMSPEAVGCQP